MVNKFYFAYPILVQINWLLYLSRVIPEPSLTLNFIRVSSRSLFPAPMTGFKILDHSDNKWAFFFQQLFWDKGWNVCCQSGQPMPSSQLANNWHIKIQIPIPLGSCRASRLFTASSYFNSQHAIIPKLSKKNKWI